jgi:putative tryptophan/tyrosine transport system substrate-binding protein
MLLFLIQAAFARDYIVILQSDTLDEYQVPATAFIESIGMQTKRFQIKGERERAVGFAEDLVQDPPPVIFALGAKAAWTARKYLPDVPLVYAMVQDPDRYGIEGENVVGISMMVPTDLTLSQFRFLVPEADRIAILVGEESKSPIVEQAIATANELGMKPEVFDISDLQELRRSLDIMPKKCDALWLLPDPSVITTDHFYYLNNLAHRARMPMLTNSIGLTRAGALVGIAPDLEAVGKQAAQLALEIRQGDESHFTQRIPPSKASVILNRNTQKSIGLELEEYSLEFVDEQIGQ